MAGSKPVYTQPTVFVETALVQTTSVKMAENPAFSLINSKPWFLHAIVDE